MKKVMFVMAVAGMFAFAACGNNGEATVEDSTAMDTMVEAVEEAAATDTTAVEAVAEEAAEVATEANAQ